MLGELWSDLRYRARALFRRADMERELDDELRFHLDMETEHNMKQGMSPDEARRIAERDFGSGLESPLPRPTAARTFAVVGISLSIIVA